MEQKINICIILLYSLSIYEGAICIIRGNLFRKWPIDVARCIPKPDNIIYQVKYINSWTCMVHSLFQQTRISFFWVQILQARSRSSPSPHPSHLFKGPQFYKKRSNFQKQQK